jgi:hypothetical protein
MQQLCYECDRRLPSSDGVVVGDRHQCVCGAWYQLYQEKINIGEPFSLDGEITSRFITVLIWKIVDMDDLTVASDDQDGDTLPPPCLKNVNADTVEVRHADLKRCSEQSLYRSWCPVCSDGILLVGRDQKTFQLLEHDRCTMCGQLVHYLDIETLRQRERGPSI